MKPFPAFLVFIKTNFDKIIGWLVDSKFESTRDIEFEIDGWKGTGGKVINNSIIYYFLDDQLVKCTWKHQQKEFMASNDQYFLDTPTIRINNNRNE